VFATLARQAFFWQKEAAEKHNIVTHIAIALAVTLQLVFALVV